MAGPAAAENDGSPHLKSRTVPPSRRAARTALLGAASARNLATAAVLAGGGFAVLDPDWFADQNGLDPYFYTGLSLNLPDALGYGAQAHYFVSRWTLYLPELLAQRALGPVAGFLATRLLLLVLVGLALAFLRPASSRPADLVPVGLVGMFSPLMIRAVFVDYSDAVVVPVGLAMLALAATAPVRATTSAVMGLLGACAVIAHPFSSVMVTIIVCGYLARFPRRPRLFVTQLAALAAAGGIVVLVGLLFFRARYGIPNVYAPTVDFALEYAGERDPLKSPRLLWLQYRLWIYLPPLVLAVAGALRAARLIRIGAAERVVFGVCAAQYAFQVLYQLVLDGLTLEISYYFSYVVPAYTAALGVVLYALLARCSATGTWVVAGAIVTTLVVWRHLPEVHLSSWAAFAVALGAAGGAGALLARRLPPALPLALVAVVLGVQLAPPDGEPRLPDELRVEAAYDSVYRQGPSLGVERFRSIPPFLDEIRGLDPEVRRRAGWVIGGGTGRQKAAAFSVQAGRPSRWLNPYGALLDPYRPVDPSRFTTRPFVELGLTHVIVVCSPDELPVVLEGLGAIGFAVGPPILDRVDPGAAAPTQVYVAPMTLVATSP